MQHIQDEFKASLQYVCISSPGEPKESCPTMYIQIVMHKIINKKTAFLSRVAGTISQSHILLVLLFNVGTQCNYHVTSDDRAWNTFLKTSTFSRRLLVHSQTTAVDFYVLVDASLEMGAFRSSRCRKETQRSNGVRKTRTQLSSVKNQAMAREVTTSVLDMVMTCIEEATTFTRQQMPPQCDLQRDK